MPDVNREMGAGDVKTTDSFSHQLFTFLLLIREKIYKQWEDSYNDKLTTLQFHVVATLGMYGSMTMSALAEIMGMQKQSATKVVNQLVGMKFIRRIDDESDRRVVRVDITPEAKAYLERFSMENMKQVCKSFEALSDGELAELRQALAVFNRILPRVSAGEKETAVFRKITTEVRARNRKAESPLLFLAVPGIIG